MRIRTKPEPLEEPALYDYAVKALGRRMRTSAELGRLMKTRVEEGESGKAKVLAVLARLTEQRYLDDPGFAATYTRLRQENEKFGRRRVQQELARKGIERDLISATLESAYESISEEALARRHLARKRFKQPTSEKESARVVRQLVRAGFSTGVIFKILQSWDASAEALAAVESIEVDVEPE